MSKYKYDEESIVTGIRGIINVIGAKQSQLNAYSQVSPYQKQLHLDIVVLAKTLVLMATAASNFKED